MNKKIRACEHPELNLPDMTFEEVSNGILDDTIQQNNIEQRHLYLTGEIDEHKVQSLVEQISYLNSVSAEPITLYINSIGGNVYDGIALCTAIENSMAPIMGFVTGICASMAMMVFACCCERVCGRFALFMVHSAKTDLGEVEQFALHTQTLHISMLNNMLSKTLSDVTNLTQQAWLDKMIAIETYFDSKTALEYGLVAEIY